MQIKRGDHWYEIKSFKLKHYFIRSKFFKEVTTSFIEKRICWRCRDKIKRNLTVTFKTFENISRINSNKIQEFEATPPSELRAALDVKLKRWNFRNRIKKITLQVSIFWISVHWIIIVKKLNTFNRINTKKIETNRNSYLDYFWWHCAVPQGPFRRWPVSQH